MITIKVDKDVLDKIENDYKENIINRDIGYILFVIKTENNIITAYNNKKGNAFKVTVQGENSYSIATHYVRNLLLVPKKEKHKKESLCFIDVDDQIGSDEVGTGDFLGPIVVCAAYCNHDAMEVIEEYGVKDSKKLTDEKIREIVPLLLKKVHYEKEILSNERYNYATNNGFNMNKIKCVLHNHVLSKLFERCPYVKNIYIDQFTSEENYYESLKGIKHIEEGIVFKEKGETYFPSVALASVIARYYFLKEMDKLKEKYGNIPFGAGEKVDTFAKELVDKIGFEEFSKIAKQNFKNYSELKKIKLL